MRAAAAVDAAVDMRRHAISMPASYACRRHVGADDVERQPCRC